MNCGGPFLEGDLSSHGGGHGRFDWCKGAPVWHLYQKGRSLVQRVPLPTESPTDLPSPSVKKSATLTVSAELYLHGYNEKHHIGGCRETLRGNELGL